MTIESEKWFHEGPIDPISKEQWLKMDPTHRRIYNLYLRKEKTEKELKEIEIELKKYESAILPAIKSNPNHPYLTWAWWETLKRSWPKWSEEFLKECGKAKHDAVKAKYKSKAVEYLRVQFIHSRPPKS